MRIKEIFKKFIWILVVFFVWNIVFSIILGALSFVFYGHFAFSYPPTNTKEFIIALSALIPAYGIATFISLKKIGKKFTLLLLFLFLLTIILMIIRLFICEPFTLANDFLEPYVYKGDYLIVQKINKVPKKGDIVITKDKKRVSLVVGLPGDKIELKNGTLFINDEPLGNIIYNFEFSSGIEPITVSEGYFCGISTRLRFENPWDPSDLSHCLYKQSDIIGKLIFPKRNIKVQKYTGVNGCNGYPSLSCPEGSKYYCPPKGKPFCCRGEVIEGYCRECPPGQDFAFSSDKKTRMCCEKNLICNGICYSECPQGEIFKCDPLKGAICE